MTVAVLKEWLAFVALAISVGGFFYAWLTRGAKDNSDQLDKLDGRVDELVTRVQAVEHELKHMPDRETIADLRISVESMKARLGGMDDQAKSTAASVRRIEDFLMKTPK